MQASVRASGKKVRTLHYIGSAEGAVKVEAAFPQVKLLMFSDGTGAVLVEQASSRQQVCGACASTTEWGSARQRPLGTA